MFKPLWIELAPEKSREYRQRRNRHDQHRACQSIFDDFDRRMMIGMNMVDQFFNRGIDQLYRQHASAGEQKKRPPDRGRLRDDKDEDNACQTADLGAKAAFAAKTGKDARESIEEALSYRLIF